jgi:hypothetical protein
MFRWIIVSSLKFRFLVLAVAGALLVFRPATFIELSLHNLTMVLIIGPILVVFVACACSQGRVGNRSAV